MLGKIPPMPSPEDFLPANGIQSTRNAVWSFIIMAAAFKSLADSKAALISLVKTAA